MQPTPLSAQQAAIQEVRTRYERGELSFEAFRRALDALVLARDAEECQVILRELPTAPAAPLAALERPDLPGAAGAPESRRGRIVAFMGQTKKLRRAWQLAPHTHALALMGEIKLDLSMAALPARARVQITAVMGSVTLYVPRSTRVTVRSTVLLGDVTALGENVNGVVAFGHEQHAPPEGPASAELEIEALVLMSNVKVVLTDGPTVSISELVRDTLRAAAEGLRRGLQQRAVARASLGMAGTGGEPIGLPRPATPAQPPESGKR